MELYIILSAAIILFFAVFWFHSTSNTINSINHIKNIFISKDIKKNIKALYNIKYYYGYKICEYGVDHDEYKEELFEMCYKIIIKNKYIFHDDETRYKYIFKLIISCLENMLKTNLTEFTEYGQKKENKYALSMKKTLDIMEDLHFIDNNEKKEITKNIKKLVEARESIDDIMSK